MTLTLLDNLLSQIVSKIPNTLYLRATDIDANISVDQVDLSGKFVCLYNNLPDIDNLVSKSGSVTRVIPISIQILKLAGLDYNTQQSDTIRDSCIEIADKIWDLVLPELSVPTIEDVDNYLLAISGEVKIYDKVLTGCTLNFTISLQRTVYLCP